MIAKKTCDFALIIKGQLFWIACFPFYVNLSFIIFYKIIFGFINDFINDFIINYIF